MKAGRWTMLVQTNQATAQNQSNMSVSQAPRAAAPRRAMLVFCSTAAFRRRVALSLSLSRRSISLNMSRAAGARMMACQVDGKQY